jgi:hypothetical protein
MPDRDNKPQQTQLTRVTDEVLHIHQDHQLKIYINTSSTGPIYTLFPTMQLDWFRFLDPHILGMFGEQRAPAIPDMIGNT